MSADFRATKLSLQSTSYQKIRRATRVLNVQKVTNIKRMHSGRPTLVQGRVVDQNGDRFQIRVTRRSVFIDTGILSVVSLFRICGWRDTIEGIAHGRSRLGGHDASCVCSLLRTGLLSGCAIQIY